MKTVMLEARQSELTGEVGLSLLDVPRNNDYGDMDSATRGALIAHDIMEHVNGPRNIGTVEDELEALGAMYAVRAWTGVLDRDGRNIHSVEDNIGSDVMRMLQLLESGNEELRFKGRTTACDYDEEFRSCIASGVNSYIKEHDYCGEEGFSRSTLESLSKTMLHYFRRGFRKAKKKYRCRNSAYSTFFAIEEAVDRAIRAVDFEGQRFKLRYSLANCEAYCEEIYEDY